MYIFRRNTEPTIGLTLESSGRGYIVTNVNEYEPAWRAGIEVGDKLRAYNLNPLQKESINWNEQALETVNMHSEQTIGIQVRKKSELLQKYDSRREYIRRQMYKKRCRESGKVICKTQIDINMRIKIWDIRNFPCKPINLTNSSDSGNISTENAASPMVDTSMAPRFPIFESSAVLSPTTSSTIDSTRANSPQRANSPTVDSSVIHYSMSYSPTIDSSRVDSLRRDNSSAVDYSMSYSPMVDSPRRDNFSEVDYSIPSPPTVDSPRTNTPIAKRSITTRPTVKRSMTTRSAAKRSIVNPPIVNTPIANHSTAKRSIANHSTAKRLIANPPIMNTQMIDNSTATTQMVDNLIATTSIVASPVGYSIDTQSVNLSFTPSEIKTIIDLTDKDDFPLISKKTTTSIIPLQQSGGPVIRISLERGWLDRIENNEWLSDDMVWFMCQRAAQLIPYNRLRIFNSHYYQTIIKPFRIGTWIDQPPIIFLPICDENHWTLLLIISLPDKTLLYYLDSLNKQCKFKNVASTMATFLRLRRVPTVYEHVIKVPVQSNAVDCGLHVISHVISLIGILDKHDDMEFVKAINKYKFCYIMNRADIKMELEDAFCESLYYPAYWARYTSGSRELWWPCRRISLKFAKRIDPFMDNLNLIPVIWFKKEKEKENAIWVDRSHIHKLNKFTLDYVLKTCNFTKEERDLLKDAYDQARSMQLV